MTASLAAWLLLGTALLTGALVYARGLVEWEGDRSRLVVGSPGPLAIFTAGAFSLSLIGHIVSLGGGIPSQPTPTISYAPPAAPTIDVVVQDTSTWWVNFSAFDGDGDDTQDSISVTVLRSGAADTLFHAVSGVQTRDTVSDNTDLKADTTYRVLGRQKGVNGGWSVADTLAVANEQPAAGPTVFFATDWGNATGTGSSAYLDGGVWDGLAFGSGPGEVRVTATDSRDYPTTNYLRTGASGSQLFAGSIMTAPSVNDSVGIRYWYRKIGTAGDLHTVIFDSDGNSSWGPAALGVYIGDSGSTNNFLISAAAGQDPRYFGPRSGSSMVDLSNNVTYRIEILYVRTGTNSYTLRGRIYNVGGTLLYDTFCDEFWHGGQCTSFTLEAQSFSVTGAGASSFTGFVLGPNGDEGSSQEEFAGLAICSAWCGGTELEGETW